MIQYPNIDPVIFKIGPLALRWYGLMYLLGFVASYLLVRFQLQKKKKFQNLDIDGLYLYLIIGLILGARLGYILFYNLGYYLQNPSQIISLWEGGMSFHGGLIGTITAGWIFTRVHKIKFFELADIVIITAPIGLGLGRLGNFINGELYGRVTTVPWGMVFPSGGPLPRHPSQLYEFFLEGVVLFSILWFLKNKNFKPGTLTGLFLIFYGIFRIFLEFFREPDVQLGFVLGPFTMGQILSTLTILAGAAIIYFTSANPTLKNRK